MDRFPESFDAFRFRGMHNNGNELRVQDRHGEARDTAVAEWNNLWNHWGRHSALERRCVGTETDSQFVCCREEVGFEGQLVELLKWMCKPSQLDDRLAFLNYFVGWPFDSVWVIVDDEYWAWD